MRERIYQMLLRALTRPKPDKEMRVTKGCRSKHVPCPNNIRSLDTFIDVLCSLVPLQRHPKDNHLEGLMRIAQE